ncbi:FecCD family ABC transporter permease [Falsirhodobacter deserti]|uniref:FecCD family ABC transporter permease n=1 Tax=Falsirhodobacter deserti TaxID=1365611 RepID=UPI000FE2E836|nr:iron ABC transporter permease [Falsirhodobacter deserti]
MRAAVLPLALVLAILASLMIGQLPVGPMALLHGALTGDGTGALVLKVIRGPRVMTAVGAGAALGLSGALFQTLFRNPLAAPDIMGFTSGSGLAIVVAVAAGLTLPVPLVAAAGGLVAAVLVALLAWRPGHSTPPLTLVLVGLGIGFATSALSSFALTSLPLNEAAEAQRWLTGSLNARAWDHAAQVWLALAMLAVLALSQLRPLEALELDSDLATGLGIRADRARWAIAAIAVLLAAAAVAVAGPVPFVALMAAPVGIRLARARDLKGRLMSGAMAGALILTLADLAAQAALPGVALPVGVATGLFGAPYLLWRLSREMKKGGL